MLNKMQSIDSKLARSVQRDYHQSANEHRAAKQSGYQPTIGATVAKTGLAVVTIMVTLIGLNVVSFI